MISKFLVRLPVRADHESFVAQVLSFLVPPEISFEEQNCSDQSFRWMSIFLSDGPKVAFSLQIPFASRTDSDRNKRDQAAVAANILSSAGVDSS